MEAAKDILKKIRKLELKTRLTGANETVPRNLGRFVLPGLSAGR